MPAQKPRPAPVMHRPMTSGSRFGGARQPFDVGDHAHGQRIQRLRPPQGDDAERAAPRVVDLLHLRSSRPPPGERLFTVAGPCLEHKERFSGRPQAGEPTRRQIPSRLAGVGARG